MNAAEIQHRAGKTAGDLRAWGRRVPENPVAALLAALAAGFLFGLVLRLFGHPRREGK